MKSRENNETFGKSQKIQEIAKKKNKSTTRIETFFENEITDVSRNSGITRKFREITKNPGNHGRLSGNHLP